jgi:hypothetical protein
MSALQIVTGIGIVLVVAGAFLAIDRMLARRAGGGKTFENSGRTTVGNALMELQSFVEPSVRHRLEEQHRQHDEDEDDGDPPVAGDTTRVPDTSIR